MSAQAKFKKVNCHAFAICQVELDFNPDTQPMCRREARNVGAREHKRTLDKAGQKRSEGAGVI
jgi:hypothetical protein